MKWFSIKTSVCIIPLYDYCPVIQQFLQVQPISIMERWFLSIKFYTLLLARHLSSLHKHSEPQNHFVIYRYHWADRISHASQHVAWIHVVSCFITAGIFLSLYNRKNAIILFKELFIKKKNCALLDFFKTGSRGKKWKLIS